MEKKTLEKTVIFLGYLSLLGVGWLRYQAAQALHVSRRPARSIRLERKPEQTRQYTYLFEGTASTEDRTALPRASVRVSVTSPHGTQIQIARADDDGRYSLAIRVEAASHDPVNWSLEAIPEDGAPVGVDGRRIVLKDDQIIVVHDGVDSMSEPTLPPANRYAPPEPYGAFS